MPRYYFHVHAPSGVARDHEGADFSDLEEARAEALACACDLAAERLRAIDLNARHAVEIADDTGAVLETLAVETILK